ncbi:MAG: phosphoribosylformylglycinamidine cyclo-ligase [Acidobacteria bacterium]|nr:phosphoribosylformylglycinamidine cyclo-ligase [Acidobacteriota bacterium]
MDNHYKKAGVDLNEAEDINKSIAEVVGKFKFSDALSKIGDFGGAFRIDTGKYKEPVFISSVDGVGTKIDVAIKAGINNTVGKDLVNHCVNDILVCGAYPLFFMDYIAYSEIDPGVIKNVIEGLALGCNDVDIPLLGGETAQMPGFYPSGKYDLVGFILGVVEKEGMITGERIEPGDVAIALPSSGLHTNGYSLARKVLFQDKGFNTDTVIPEIGKPLKEVLLAVHKPYLKQTQFLLQNGIEIKGMAHITGGGIRGNLSRILPDDVDAVINADSWQHPQIFKSIQKYGEITWDEMFDVFNMGIGFIYVVGKEHSNSFRQIMERMGEKAIIMGNINAGTGKVLLKQD